MEELLNTLRKIPDFDRYPLPLCVHEQFKIPYPTPSDDFMAAVINQQAPPVCRYEKMEFRPAAEGGVRDIPLPETPLKVWVETEPIKDQTSAEDERYSQTMSAMKIESTESTESKEQEPKSSSENK